MLTILLHSSKTMRPAAPVDATYQRPRLQDDANQLHNYVTSLAQEQLERCMHLSPAKASQTRELIRSWRDDPSDARPAIDAFLGDIYSGLQVATFSQADRAYANNHLLILSGLYGGLRALDSIYPYRLEMGYKLPVPTYSNLYTYWNDKISQLIPADSMIVNLSAVEYTKAVLPYLNTTVVTPKFLTVSPKSGQPTFVTVHAKIARGAYAHWLITQRIESPDRLKEFSELGYCYDSATSTPEHPVFICKNFQGLGLSVRLT